MLPAHIKCKYAKNFSLECILCVVVVAVVVAVVVLCVCCDLSRPLVAFFSSQKIRRENFPLAAGLLATCHLPLATCLLPRLLNAFLMRASICARCVSVASYSCCCRCGVCSRICSSRCTVQIFVAYFLVLP